jgi:hypothetical protein
MLGRLHLLVGLAASLPLLACGSEDEEKNQAPDAANALLAEIQGEYRSWARAPGYEQRMPTSAPHGEQVDIYVNPTLAAAVSGPAVTEWPVDSIVAKDGWQADGQTLEVIAVMQKRADGWFYAEYDGGGSPLYSGQPSVCTGCHGQGSDQILAFGFPQ